MERPCGQVAGRRLVSQSFDQRFHLGLGEPVAHLDGRVAGDGGQNVVLAAVAGLGAVHGREGVLEGAGHVPVGEGGDDGRHAHRAGSEGLGLEAVDGELFEVLGRDLGVRGGELDDLGDEQALDRRRAVGVGQPVEDGPLVGDVLVHDPQAGLRLLDEDVSRRELADDPQVLQRRQRPPLGRLALRATVGRPFLAPRTLPRAATKPP